MKKYTIKKDQTRQIVIKESGDYNVKLAGEGAHAQILGAFWLKNEEKLEINVTTIHAARHTSADTFLRAIADDQSNATINGTIIVEKGAQQTDSLLKEDVLLLSKAAQAHAIPNLEIEADDVKCTHAATVGNIGDEEIFYLMSRGIGEEKAKTLIAEGFLQAVKDKINQ